MTQHEAATTVDTALGPVDHVDRGAGAPVLFVHGSPGGADQGVLMTEFLVAAGFRVITPSRPGYFGTPIDDDRRSPEAQADLHAALLDALDIERVAVMCWSGGGPSSYRLAAERPGRVTALVGIAAVSKAYTFASPAEENLLVGRLGGWLMKELRRHAPKSTVKMLAGEEGDLTKEQVKELAAEIWSDPLKRQFVLDLTATVSGPERKQGLLNDEQQFPLIGDLGLATIVQPALLIHARTDSDVPFEHSDHAAGLLPNVTTHWIEAGTHLSAWTDPDADAIQGQIVEALRRA